MEWWNIGMMEYWNVGFMQKDLELAAVQFDSFFTIKFYLKAGTEHLPFQPTEIERSLIFMSAK